MRARTSVAGMLAAAGLLLSAACANDRVTAPDLRVADDGVVRYVSLEGGFYAIETSSGRRLDPVNLPIEFRQDRLAVHVRGSVLTGMGSVHMYGEVFEIAEIARR